MIQIRILLSCLLISAPAAPVAASPAADSSANVQSEAASHRAQALKMARLMQGGDRLSPQIKQELSDQLTQVFRNDADMQFLETEYPGVTTAVIDAIVPVAVRQTEATLPALFTQLADLYAAEMTADEIEQALQWFSSKNFSRVQASMEANIDLKEIIADSMKDENAKVTSEDLQKLELESAARSYSSFSLEDRAALMRFSATPAFQKLEKLKPKALAIEATWSNETNAEDDAEIEAVTTRILEKFMGVDLSDVE